MKLEDPQNLPQTRELNLQWRLPRGSVRWMSTSELRRLLGAVDGALSIVTQNAGSLDEDEKRARNLLVAARRELESLLSTKTSKR